MSCRVGERWVNHRPTHPTINALLGDIHKCVKQCSWWVTTLRVRVLWRIFPLRTRIYAGGFLIRIAATTNSSRAKMALEYDLLMWVRVFTCTATMSDAMTRGKVTTVSDRDRILN